MDALKRSIERAWAKHLDEAEAVTVPVYATRRHEYTDPPYAVCTVAKMEETVPRSSVYRVQLDIVLVSHIDDGGPSAPETHSGQWKAIKDALDSIPDHGKDTTENVMIHGWCPTETAPAKDDQHYADVQSIVMGASRLS